MHDWQNAPHSNAREWRVVVAAEVVSVLGDQLSRVGLSLLVFDRTGSAGLTGLTYAATLLPDLAAGPLLAPLADRYPRRDVMIVCALLQAALVASMLIPGLPFVALVAAVAATAALQAPAKAAQTPLIRQILGPRQVAGQGTITIIQQLGQIGGLAGAATVIATLGATAALAADAASFLAVAALLHLGVRRRPAALQPTSPHPEALPRPAASQSPHRAQRRAALRLMTSDPQLRCVTLAVLSVSGCVAPAVVIAPLVAQLNAPTWASGPLLAADCAGMIAATYLLCTAPQKPRSEDRARRALRVRAHITRHASIPALAVLASAPLIGFVTHPSVGAAAVLLVLVGVGSALLPLAKAAAAPPTVPEHLTGTVNGLMRTCVRGGQGLAAALTASVSAIASPTVAITAAGALCLAIATTGAVLWTRADPATLAAAHAAT